MYSTVAILETTYLQLEHAAAVVSVVFCPSAKVAPWELGELAA